MQRTGLSFGCRVDGWLMAKTSCCFTFMALHELEGFQSSNGTSHLVKAIESGYHALRDGVKLLTGGLVGRSFRGINAELSSKHLSSNLASPSSSSTATTSTYRTQHIPPQPTELLQLSTPFSRPRRPSIDPTTYRLSSSPHLPDAHPPNPQP